MPRRPKPRLFDPEKLYFITSRCFDGQFLLRPCPEINEIVGSVTARALAQNDVTLYGLVAMSNHVHAIVRGDGAAIAGFCCHLFGQIAKRVNRVWDRKGPVFPNPYAASPILDDEAAWQVLSYLYLNPVKANLCDKAQDWVGFSTLPESLGDTPRTYTYLDKEAYNAVSTRHPGTERGPFEEDHELKVAPLPAFEGARQEFVAGLREKLSLGEEKFRKVRRAIGLELPTPRYLTTIEPTTAPPQPKKSPQPLCHAVCDKLRKAYKRTYRLFCDAYQRASEAYRNGHFSVDFPEFSFRPPLGPVARAPG